MLLFIGAPSTFCCRRCYFALLLNLPAQAFFFRLFALQLVGGQLRRGRCPGLVLLRCRECCLGFSADALLFLFSCYGSLLGVARFLISVLLSCSGFLHCGASGADVMTQVMNTLLLLGHFPLQLVFMVLQGVTQVVLDRSLLCCRGAKVHHLRCRLLCFGASFFLGASRLV